MLIEDLSLSPSYDIERLTKAQKGLARKSNDFYAVNGRLNILIKLMRSDPSSNKITDLINELPWRASSYIMSKVVKVMPDGVPNRSYKG